MRTLVCGGRDFADWRYLCRMLDGAGVTLVIHGGAAGADTLAGRWAASRGVPAEVYPADWSRWGRAAGPRRNREMLGRGCPDVVVAFAGGRGTANMVGQARAAGVPVVEW